MIKDQTNNEIKAGRSEIKKVQGRREKRNKKEIGEEKGQYVREKREIHWS